MRGKNLRIRYRVGYVAALSVCALTVALSGCSMAAPASSPSSPSSPPLASAANAIVQVQGALQTQQQAQTAPANAIPAGAPTVGARAAYLMNADTGTVYYALNANTEMPMASTTKVMTALVALRFGKLDQTITVGADAAAMNNGQDSVAGVQTGNVMTLHDLLYALMLPSGDDAAVAIADGIAGSQSAFVQLMNAYAFLIGLTHTHYADVTGLDTAGHYTTVHDLSVLTRFAMQNPTVARIVATPRYTIYATGSHPRFDLTNTNNLLPGLPDAYNGAVGVKTGYTGGAGYCLVFEATRDGHKLLGVVLGEPNEQERFTDATALLDWGFPYAAQHP